MKNHTKAPHTVEGTLISADEMEEMAFQEHNLMKVDRKAHLYRYTDDGGVHYVAPMEPEPEVFVQAPDSFGSGMFEGPERLGPIADPDAAWSAQPVDSTSYTLPDGRTVIGKDAYEAEVVKAVFKR